MGSAAAGSGSSPAVQEGPYGLMLLVGAAAVSHRVRLGDQARRDTVLEPDADGQFGSADGRVAVRGDARAELDRGRQRIVGARVDAPPPAAAGPLGGGPCEAVSLFGP